MRRFTRIFACLFAVLSVTVLLTGLTEVRPGEAVVVRRFGRALSRPWRPGLHWSIPLGVDRLDRVRLDEVRRLAVGGTGAASADQDPGAGEYLTGDLNFVRARVVVQYTVGEPIDFALRSAERDRLLAHAVDAALARALATRPVDALLGPERTAVADELRRELVRQAEQARLGIASPAVQLTDLRPPPEVALDFAAAAAARSTRDRRITEASTRAGVLGSEAESEAAAIARKAAAESTRTVALARASAHRYAKLREEWRRAPTLTARRLHREAVRELMARIGRKVVVSPDLPVDLSLFGAGDRAK